ncbi:glycosyltransferase, partial [Streptomyces sp. SA3_actF]|uniref:glycosyltransferase n=1 Tax=Streptomyces sp. SA3_actF TaxID=682181 RepID=UPI003B6382A7
MVSEHASPLAALGGADAGGQNVYVARLAEQLARDGHEVTVYTRRDDPASPPSSRPGRGYGSRTWTRARPPPYRRTSSCRTFRRSRHDCTMTFCAGRPTSCTRTSGCRGSPPSRRP